MTRRPPQASPNYRPRWHATFCCARTPDRGCRWPAMSSTRSARWVGWIGINCLRPPGSSRRRPQYGQCTMRPDHVPWTFPFAVAELQDHGVRIAIEANETERAAVAELAGLRDLPQLAAQFEL